MFVTAPDLAADGLSYQPAVENNQPQLGVQVLVEGSTKANRCAMVVLSCLEILLSLVAFVGSIVMAALIGGVGVGLVASCVALVCVVTIFGSSMLLHASMKAARQAQVATTTDEAQAPQVVVEETLPESEGVVNA